MSDADRGARLREWLRRRGVSDEAIERAAAQDQLHLLVLDRALLPAERALTAGEVARETGFPEDLIFRFRRALGFPDVAPEEPVFTEFDVEALNNTRTLMRLSMAGLDSALQLARVIGSSMEKIAEAEVETSPVLRGEMTSLEVAELYAVTADYTLPETARILEYTWRRHLQEAMRRAMLLSRSLDEPVTLAVGFADLVGFTALSQQLSSEALGQLVSRFEDLAYDTVARLGARVVKMIGDEVMYTAVEPDVAARVGLSLAEAYADDDMLSDVRVGLAYGPVLLRDGDCYGVVVNLANRLVKIAAEGSVLASDGLHAALEADDRFDWRAMRPRYLKGLGKVPVWVLRGAGAGGGERGGTDRRRRWMVKDQLREALERSLPRRARAAVRASDAAGSPGGGAPVEP